MAVHYNEKLGEILGLFDSLFYAWNLNNHNEDSEVIGYKIEDKLFKDFIVISEYLKNNQQDMDFFFNYESKLYKAFIKLDMMSQCNSIEEYLEKIQSITEYDIRKYLVENYLNFEPSMKREKIKQVTNDSMSVLHFIKYINISDKSKWQIFCMLDDINETISRFISFIKRYSLFYYDVYISNKRLIDERNKFIKDIVNKEDFNSLIAKIENNIDLKDYNSLYISFSYFNTYKFYIEQNKDTNTCYIILGSRNSLSTQYIDPKAEFDANRSVLKNLSDETRFKIVTFLLSGEKYAQEIAEMANISNSTVNYHMNHLTLSGLIFTQKIENKVYYALNKDRLQRCVEYLMRIFQI